MKRNAIILTIVAAVCAVCIGYYLSRAVQPHSDIIQDLDLTGETTEQIADKRESQTDSRAQEDVTSPVAVATRAPEGTVFVNGWKSSTYSVVPLRGSIVRNGKILLSFPDRVDHVRESPDQKMFVSYGPPYGWQVHSITETGCIKVEDQLPKNEDLQLYWIDNQTLLGTSVIYEETSRPSMEDSFAADTRLFVYDVFTAESHDLDISSIKRGPGTFLRIDATSKEGFIKLSLVTSDQYFTGECVHDLGVFTINSK